MPCSATADASGFYSHDEQSERQRDPDQLDRALSSRHDCREDQPDAKEAEHALALFRGEPESMLEHETQPRKRSTSR